jgi:hypothetical protein
MKKSACLILVLALVTLTMKAQQRGDFFAGINLASAPSGVVETNLEFFPVGRLSLNASGGYCFNHKSTTMVTVTETILGGFIRFGGRYYLNVGENLDLYFGLGFYYGNFKRSAVLGVDHFYGTYTESSLIRQEKPGWHTIFGLQFRHKWLVLQPGFRIAAIRDRDDAYQFDYWTPGSGRVGLGSNADSRSYNWGPVAVFQAKFAF